MNRPPFVSISGVLLAMIGILSFLTGGAAAVLLTPSNRVAALALTVSAVFLGLILVAGGIGLLFMGRTGRVIAMAAAMLLLLCVPSGTIVGVSLLYFLTRPAVRKLFGRETPTESEAAEVSAELAGATRVGFIGYGAALLAAILTIVPAGIVAAIAIPNFASAIERSKQKRTLADINALGAALEVYQIDHGFYPEAGSIDELARALDPLYMASAPRADAWSRPLSYETVADPGAAPFAYALGSSGKNGIFSKSSLFDYTPGPTSLFDCDIVYSRGGFVAAPASAHKTIVQGFPPSRPTPTAPIAAPATPDPFPPPDEPEATHLLESEEPNPLPTAPTASPEKTSPKREARRGRRRAKAKPDPSPPTGQTKEQEPGDIVDVPFSKTKLLHQVAPVYPPIAKRAGVTGTVILSAIINEKGDVKKVKVLRSVPLLDQAAIGAVKQWKFEPKRVKGKPVRMRLTVTVGFKIE